MTPTAVASPALPSAMEPRRTESVRLERVAAQRLSQALGLRGTLHEPGQRERFRRHLEGAIDEAERALTAAVGENGEESAPVATVVRARVTLVHAYAARAEDALHGANQLSMSAQRAPTNEACDEGWQRVEARAGVAEMSARRAATLAAALADEAPGSAVARAAHRAVQPAEAAARAARQLVEARNHAYTFHTDGGFSFGEGWCVAAAALLAGVAVQIEPARPATEQAAWFLGEAGLSPQVQPYRSRPRAMKQSTPLVAHAFRDDPVGAQQKLRAAFLGSAPPAPAVVGWVDQKLAGVPEGKKALLWIRVGQHHRGRNTAATELAELTRRVQAAGLTPVWLGDALPDVKLPGGAIDLTLFWKEPLFQRTDGRRAQLQLFEHLKVRHGVVGQLGVTTAGMDGPALLGLATMYLTDVRNVRMHAWVGAVPGYEEVVRDDGYLERVSQRLAAWARGGTVGFSGN